MTRAEGLVAINCTSCGAGLDVLGGGRVTTHICPYCGSELDAQHDYAVLKKLANADRPSSPFRIGMTGRLFGVDWTVIGTLGQQESWRGEIWKWADHQLYSPTHGYAWLTVENGHMVFTRRFRGVVRPSWISTTWVETAEHPPSVFCRGERFTYLETSTSEVTFAEGEFTYSPRIGERTLTVSAMSERHMLDFSSVGAEREVYRGTYIPVQQGLAAFGLPDDALSPGGVHPLQPFQPWRHTDFLQLGAGVAALVCFVLAAWLHLSPGREVLAPVSFQVADLPQSANFEISDTGRLAGLYLESDVSNSWTYQEIEMTDPEGETLFEAGRTMEYYFGSEGGERWTEGSRRARLYFRPTLAGAYTVTLFPPETGRWGSAGREPQTVTLWVRSQLSSGLWLAMLGFGFAVLALLRQGRRWWHNRLRWRHSDWTEE